MSSLMEFLIDNPVDNITADVFVSNRFTDSKTGEILKFKIKAMTGDEFSTYQRISVNLSKNKIKEFDSKKFNELVVLNNTIEPNFRDAASITKAGCQTSEQFMYKAILAGEIATLAEHISKLSGFDIDINEAKEEAKNY